ncbi:MAG: M20/M25/M40 family metallo-hydrolase [Myxococcota bacterium]
MRANSTSIPNTAVRVNVLEEADAAKAAPEAAPQKVSTEAPTLTPEYAAIAEEGQKTRADQKSTRLIPHGAILSATAVKSPGEVTAEITARIAELVQIRSQGGIDNPREICKAILRQLDEAGIQGTLLTDPKGRPVGVTAEIGGKKPGPVYALDAVVDTAPVGDLGSWKKDPFGAEIEGNTMSGRGTADSKAAASIFIEVGRQLKAVEQDLRGKAVLFFDAAEHTGEFQGVKAFLEKYPKLDGVMIGYPGDKELCIGSRGFLRSSVQVSFEKAGDPSSIAAALRGPYQTPLPTAATPEFPHPPKLTLTAASSAPSASATPGSFQAFELRISGKAAHSGSSKPGGTNAILKAATILEQLAGSGAIVQGLKGGNGYAVVPDRCDLSIAFPASVPDPKALVEKALAAADAALDAGQKSSIVSSKAIQEARPLGSVEEKIDIRTTAVFGDADARSHLGEELKTAAKQGGFSTKVDEMAPWPAFVLAADHPLRKEMEAAMAPGFGAIPSVVSGPSNVGNFLASYGIPATTGLGVAFTNMHAANESIALDSIPKVLDAYRRVMGSLLGAPGA